MYQYESFLCAPRVTSPREYWTVPRLRRCIRVRSRYSQPPARWRAMSASPGRRPPIHLISYFSLRVLLSREYLAHACFESRDHRWFDNGKPTAGVVSWIEVQRNEHEKTSDRGGILVTVSGTGFETISGGVSSPRILWQKQQRSWTRQCLNPSMKR